MLGASQSQAQSIACGKHEAIVAALKSHYQENRQAIGLAATAGVVELYVSAAGTWTMIVTTPAGQTCIAAAGKAWQSMPQLKAETNT
ncbi:MAG: hypothetical protein M3N38_03695 [Pseudomonadota bacterium]|nr:hypothetical protein [Pseudomonadota bacterium]